jgi:hypothetical protein
VRKNVWNAKQKKTKNKNERFNFGTIEKEKLIKN